MVMGSSIRHRKAPGLKEPTANLARRTGAAHRHERWTSLTESEINYAKGADQPGRGGLLGRAQQGSARLCRRSGNANSAAYVLNDRLLHWSVRRHESGLVQACPGGEREGAVPPVPLAWTVALAERPHRARRRSAPWTEGTGISGATRTSALARCPAQRARNAARYRGGTQDRCSNATQCLRHASRGRSELRKVSLRGVPPDRRGLPADSQAGARAVPLRSPRPSDRLGERPRLYHLNKETARSSN